MPIDNVTKSLEAYLWQQILEPVWHGESHQPNLWDNAREEIRHLHFDLQWHGAQLKLMQLQGNQVPAWALIHRTFLPVTSLSSSKTYENLLSVAISSQVMLRIVYYRFTFSLPPELLAWTSPTNFSAFADWGIAFIASLAAWRASLTLENARYEWTKPEIIIVKGLLGLHNLMILSFLEYNYIKQIEGSGRDKMNLMQLNSEFAQFSP